MNFPIRGEVMGADFSGRFTDGDERTVILVAVDTNVVVGHCRVVMLDADEFERSLPTADEVFGILGAEATTDA